MSTRGVQVRGEIRDFSGSPIAGRELTISLPVVCSWQGKLLITRQVAITNDRGEFEFWLPPTEELVPVDGSQPPNYHIVAKGVGAWDFQVPGGHASITLGQALED